MTAVLALDVGGTKIAAGIADETGALRSTSRAPVTPGGDAEQLWSVLTTLVDDVVERAGAPIDAVGIACGGPMEWPAGVVSPLNIPGWRGFPLLERVSSRYAPGRPSAIHNDAVAVALAEHRWGAGRGVQNVLGMVVSTGVGGGLISGGRVVDGGTGNAGHIGHVVVDPRGPACACGGRGCLEAMAAGPAIAKRAAAAGWVGIPTAEGVAVGARGGDPACREALAHAGWAVGVAVASAAALLDLDVVSIGGGVSQAGPLLFDPLLVAFREHARLSFVGRTRVVPAELGQDAGLAGAAALVLG